MEVSGQLHIPAHYSRGKNTSAHLTGGRMGPRAGLGRCGEEKNVITAPAGN
jgi:hypothetical protein